MPRKTDFRDDPRLFLGAVAGFAVLVTGLGAFLWTQWPAVAHHERWFFVLALGVAVLVLSWLAIDAWLLTFFSLWARSSFFLSWALFLLLRRLGRVILGLGRAVGLPYESLAQSFCALNNRIVGRLIAHDAPNKVLLLLPHCVQNHDCQHRVHANQINCVSCGRCEIGALRELVGGPVAMSVATGGRLARRLVAEHKAEVIVAVACEEDLTQGIIDTYPLPVLGLVNWRPYGPCRDTQTDLRWIRNTLAQLTGAKMEQEDEGKGVSGHERD